LHTHAHPQLSHFLAGTKKKVKTNKLEKKYKNLHIIESCFGVWQGVWQLHHPPLVVVVARELPLVHQYLQARSVEHEFQLVPVVLALQLHVGQH
jgi:hypothetical protein